MKGAAAILLVVYLVAVSSAQLVITKAKREIDLTGHLGRESTSLTIENQGKSTETQVVVAFTSDRIAYVSVQGEDETELTVGEPEISKLKSGQVYSKFVVTLNEALPPKGKIDLDIYAVSTQVQTPHPPKIAQSSRQHVLFVENHYILSPYKIVEQTTEVSLAGPIDNFSEGPGERKKISQTVEYGPYKNVDPFSFSELSIHYENNTPFISAEWLKKEIEVSHWGNVAVTEEYRVRHSGSKLKGGFSRFDYMHGIKGNSVDEFEIFLPPGSTNVYYRDELGNVTSSHLSVVNATEEVKLELKPRFVMFGGWAIEFLLGYDIPSYRVLGSDVNDGSRYVLNISFVPEFVNVDIAQSQIKVILPEGATNIETHFPFKVASVQESARHTTYLDTSGRPTLTITKSNIVPEHAEYFQVSYSFSSTSLFHEPLLLISAYFSFFVIAMVYVRFELKISDSDDNDQTNSVGELVEQIIISLNSLEKGRKILDAALDAFNRTSGDNKDLNTYNNAKAKYEKEFAKQIDELQGLVKTSAGKKYTNQLKRLIEKVEELNRVFFQQQQEIRSKKNLTPSDLANFTARISALDKDASNVVDIISADL